MFQNNRESNSIWRQNWFVVNVLVELPIIGSFFKFENFSSGLHEAGKCTAMLAGGTATMMTILAPTDTDNMQMKVLKMSTSMAIGMTAGKVTYNSLYSGGAILYNFLSKRCLSNQVDIHEITELQSLKPNNLII